MVMVNMAGMFLFFCFLFLFLDLACVRCGTDKSCANHLDTTHRTEREHAVQPVHRGEGRLREKKALKRGVVQYEEKVAHWTREDVVKT